MQATTIKKELLAPAGNYESFLAALQNGADAIYLSGISFGARAYAKNFTAEELENAIQMGHLYGVKVYITMNTMVKEQEVEEFLSQVAFLYKRGVDAIIMQDIGMICLCREMFPELEIHASTQVNNATEDTIHLLEKIGVKRVVLPREMSLSEINHLQTSMEKEVFIHGALCVSYSGNCLFSFLNGGRSANRGACAGCCRLPFTLYKNGKKVQTGHLLSMKEFHTAPFFSAILKSDIDSLKIEGRMKSPSYVACVTRYYRKLLDGKTPSTKDLEELKILFYREFTQGHLFEEDDLINAKQPNHIGLEIGTVSSVTKDKIGIQLSYPLYQEDGIRFMKAKKGFITNFIYNKEGKLIASAEKGETVFLDNIIHLKEKDRVFKTSSVHLQKELLKENRKTVPIQITLEARVGFPLKLSLQDKDGHFVEVQGSVVESAKNCAISVSKITELLTRLKDTPFQEEKIQLNIDRNIFIRVGELNALRREATGKLEEARVKVPLRKVVTKMKLRKWNYLSKKEKTAFVNKEKTIKRILRNDYTRIYVGNEELYKKYSSFSNVYYAIPRNQLNRKVSSSKVFSQELRTTFSNIVGGYSLNVANAYSAYYLTLMGYESVCLSVELSEEERRLLLESVKKHFGFLPLEVITKGRVDAMVIKGNPLQLKMGEEAFLEDTKNIKYPAYFDGRLTIIKSGFIIDLTKEEDLLHELGVTAFCKILDE